MTTILLDHGADINHPFLVEGLPPRNALSDAIAVGDEQLISFLKSRGAMPPVAVSKKKEEISILGEYDHEIVFHFQKHFGKSERKAITGIVEYPDRPVLIRYIPPSSKCNNSVLFTVGLNQFKMPAPQDCQQFEHAELMILLPKTWPAPDKALKSKKWAWPIQWLRKIARYPIENETWLGAHLTVLTEEESPAQLAPGVVFTSWLLISLPTDDLVINCKDGKKIQIYQLFPIYTEEYHYALKHGATALMQLLSEKGIQTHVQLGRPNVALHEVHRVP
jgi:hypothetical protein